MGVILAIDPGANGAACLFGGRVLEVVKFAGLGETDLAGHIVRLAGSADRIVIERVHAMPGDGVRNISTRSAFAFGQGYGFLRGCLCVTAISWESVPPQTWQKDLGLGKCSGKDRKRKLRELAAQRFPEEKPTLDTCDAMLLAEWAWRAWQVFSAAMAAKEAK